jgi:hypothetical protein
LLLTDILFNHGDGGIHSSEIHMDFCRTQDAAFFLSEVSSSSSDTDVDPYAIIRHLQDSIFRL